MKRAPPSISPAQSKSIAAYSKLQASSEAQTQRAEAALHDFEREMSHLDADLRKHGASIASAKKWFPRIAVFLVAILALVGIFILFYGLKTGELPGIGKSAKNHVFQSESPLVFWFVFSFHLSVTCLLGWSTVSLFKATGWFPSSKP